MSIEKELLDRSGGQCELCASAGNLKVYEVKPSSNRGGDDYIMICNNCLEQLSDETKIDVNHWRCLNESMWSEVGAVKVVVWRMLNKIKLEGWPIDLLEQMYMEDDVLSWAKEGESSSKDTVVHKDSNGAVLSAGDSVVLIKDLDVKGANFTAKRGTTVRGITLVYDNASQIEGKVNGQHIVILTQFVKKS